MAARKKPGHVLRVDPTTWKFIEAKRKPKEPLVVLMRRLLGLPPKKGTPGESVKVFYILPESGIVCKSLAEAKGEAILRAVRKGKKKQIEEPIEVRAIGE